MQHTQRMATCPARHGTDFSLFVRQEGGAARATCVAPAQQLRVALATDLSQPAHSATQSRLPNSRFCCGPCMVANNMHTHRLSVPRPMPRTAVPQDLLRAFPDSNSIDVDNLFTLGQVGLHGSHVRMGLHACMCLRTRSWAMYVGTAAHDRQKGVAAYTFM